MDFKELALSRYSVRKFSSAKVEPEKLTQVLEAGRSAPSGHNQQPTRFLVLQSEGALKKVEDCTRTGAHYHSPVVIVVSYDAKAAWVRDDDGKNHGEIDAAIAASQIMLQATDLGLGTVYVGAFDVKTLLASFPQLDGLTPIALIPLGYPADDAAPSHVHEVRKPLDEVVTYL
jgi:nitroreductase